MLTARAISKAHKASGSIKTNIIKWTHIQVKAYKYILIFHPESLQVNVSIQTIFDVDAY